MRHLGPIHFRFLGNTPEERQYAQLFQAQARTMVGQMLSFSGDVAVNGFNRRFPDGTRISVAMARGGVVPIFLATIMPPSLAHIRRREDEEPVRAPRPYFFAGLEYVSGGEFIEVNPEPAKDAYLWQSSVDSWNNTLTNIIKPRVIPRLVVWEPASGDKEHDDPVCVKRISNPVRGLSWTLKFYTKPVTDVEENGIQPPVEDTHINAAFDSSVYYSNPIQNAYWWYDQEASRWRYSLFARNNNGLYVWEYDNQGNEARTPNPRSGEKYLAIAVADEEPPYDDAAPERFKSFDDVSFQTSFLDVPNWQWWFTYQLFNFEKQYAPGTSLEPTGEPPMPYHPAKLVGGNYAIKIVVEGRNDLEFSPLTVRLRVQTGMDTNGNGPLFDDVYTLTIDGHSQSRRVLFPGGYNGDWSIEGGTPSQFQANSVGPNPMGPAWSSDTILANPFGGSSLSDFVPWGLEPQPYEIPYFSIIYSQNDYRGWLTSFST